MGAVGIDLGTSRTVVCDPRRGVLFDEPSVLAVRAGRRRKEAVTVGTEAADLAGRVPAGLLVSHPLHDGAVGDLEVSRAFLRAVLTRLRAGRWARWRMSAALTVAAGATPLERRALLEVGQEAGLRNVQLIPAPVAGAISCGADPMRPRAGLAADIGEGTAEIVAFCYGGVLSAQSTRIAGAELTEVLRCYVREQHRVVLSKADAELLKSRLSAADPEPSLIVAGRDAAGGRPRLVTVPVEELTEALRPIAELIAAALAAVVEDLPSQALTDVIADGALLFGGGALLRGLPKILEQALGLPVTVAERPLTCVAEGAASALAMPRLLDSFNS